MDYSQHNSLFEEPHFDIFSPQKTNNLRRSYTSDDSLFNVPPIKNTPIEYIDDKPEEDIYTRVVQSLTRKPMVETGFLVNKYGTNRKKQLNVPNESLRRHSADVLLDFTTSEPKIVGAPTKKLDLTSIDLSDKVNTNCLLKVPTINISASTEPNSQNSSAQSLISLISRSSQSSTPPRILELSLDLSDKNEQEPVNKCWRSPDEVRLEKQEFFNKLNEKLNQNDENITKCSNTVQLLIQHFDNKSLNRINSNSVPNLTDKVKDGEKKYNSSEQLSDNKLTDEERAKIVKQLEFWSTFGTKKEQEQEEIIHEIEPSNHKPKILQVIRKHPKNCKKICCSNDYFKFSFQQAFSQSINLSADSLATNATPPSLNHSLESNLSNTSTVSMNSQVFNTKLKPVCSTKKCLFKSQSVDNVTKSDFANKFNKPLIKYGSLERLTDIKETITRKKFPESFIVRKSKTSNEISNTGNENQLLLSKGRSKSISNISNSYNNKIFIKKCCKRAKQSCPVVKKIDMTPTKRKSKSYSDLNQMYLDKIIKYGFEDSFDCHYFNDTAFFRNNYNIVRPAWNSQEQCKINPI